MSAKGIMIVCIAALLLSASPAGAAGRREIPPVVTFGSAVISDPECDDEDRACVIRRLTRRMTSEVRNNRLYFERAKAHLDAENFGSAEKDYTRYLRSNPDDTDALYGRGLALSNLGRDIQAINDFGRAIRLDPANAAFYLARGYSLNEIGKDKEAVADYSKAIEFDPAFVQAYLNRAMITDDTDPARAYADYSKAIELDPDYDAGAYIYRAKILTDRREFEKALSDLNEAIKRSPENSEAYFTLAFTRWSMGDLKAGIDNVSKAIELDPTRAHYFESRARTYDHIGEPVKAEADRAAAAKIKRAK